MIVIEASCDHCHRFRKADIGDDPLVDGRITEILGRHRSKWLLRRCTGSGTDANPVAVS